MSKRNLNRAQRMTVDEIATVAAAGVARALAARQTAAVELSAEELAQVEGGISLRGPIIYGGLLAYSSAVTQLDNPAAQLGNPAQFGHGARVTVWLRTANPSARAPSPSGRAHRCSEWSVGRQMRRQRRICPPPSRLPSSYCSLPDLYGQARCSVLLLHAPVTDAGIFLPRPRRAVWLKKRSAGSRQWSIPSPPAPFDQSASGGNRKAKLPVSAARR